MIGVGARNVVLARGRLDKLEGPKYAARRAELRRRDARGEREAARARARDRQAAAASQNEAEVRRAMSQSEDETAGERQGERTTRLFP